MALTDTQCKAATFSGKPRKLTDGLGLYLLVTASGRYWRQDYTYQGKRKTAAHGVYPAVSLKDARQARDVLRVALGKGVDLRAKITPADASNTLEAVARAWHARTSGTWRANHVERVMQRLEQEVFPVLGALDINTIAPRQVLALLRRIEERGAPEVAQKTRQTLGQVFRYGVACGHCETDPTGALRGALVARKAKHHNSVTDPAEIGRLMRSIDCFTGRPITRAAMRFSALVFTRPGEVRHAEWSEIDFATAEWKIPGEKMKMHKPHIVPLSRQAVEVLQDLHKTTGDGRWVFPASYGGQMLSENTVGVALKRIGYRATAHGFRSMASTRLHEMGWLHEAIELQLAHSPGDAVSGAYNYAKHLPLRREMMQAWADYLDSLRDGGNVVPIKSKAA